MSAHARGRLAVAVAVTAVLAGCGSTKSTASGTPASSSSGSGHGSGNVSLSEKEFKITPANVHVARTGLVTITVRNDGTVTHALAVQTASGVIRTAPLSPGSSATLRFKAAHAGNYVFFCPIANHRQLGMQGMLVVGSGGGAPAGTSTSSGGSGGSGGGGSYGY